MRRLLLVLALLLAAVGPAAARVLLVGPGEALARPSDAARVAKDGDEVPERLLPDGPYRVEVRSELGDLPVDEPGVFTMQRVGP